LSPVALAKPLTRTPLAFCQNASGQQYFSYFRIADYSTIDQTLK